MESGELRVESEERLLPLWLIALGVICAVALVAVVIWRGPREGLLLANIGVGLMLAADAAYFGAKWDRSTEQFRRAARSFSAAMLALWMFGFVGIRGEAVVVVHAAILPVSIGLYLLARWLSSRARR